MSTSIASLFASEPLVRVLSVLLMHPERRFYQQELLRATGTSLRPLQLSLQRVERAGLVEKHREGRNTYYRVRRDHPAFPGLREAFLRTVSLGDVLRDALAPLAGRIVLAFVFGSLAAGDDRPDSDVDVIVVGDTGLREIADSTAEAERLVDRELNLITYEVEEFRERAHDAGSFIADVVAGPKIWLVGGDHELEQLVEGRHGKETAGTS